MMASAINPYQSMVNIRGDCVDTYPALLLAVLWLLSERGWRQARVRLVVNTHESFSSISRVNIHSGLGLDNPIMPVYHSAAALHAVQTLGIYSTRL